MEVLTVRLRTLLGTPPCPTRRYNSRVRRVSHHQIWYLGPNFENTIALWRESAESRAATTISCYLTSGLNRLAPLHIVRPEGAAESFILVELPGHPDRSGFGVEPHHRPLAAGLSKDLLTFSVTSCFLLSLALNLAGADFHPFRRRPASQLIRKHTTMAADRGEQAPLAPREQQRSRKSRLTSCPSFRVIVPILPLHRMLTVVSARS